MISEVARFYGFSHSEITTMYCDDFISYYRCISKIRAKEMLEEFRVASFPNVEPKDRKEMVKSLERQVFKNDSKTKIISMDELMRLHE